MYVSAFNNLITTGINPKRVSAVERTKSFANIKNTLANTDLSYQDHLNQLESVVAKGKTLKVSELLVHQVKAQQFHMQVELVSKAAESLVATVRKFQHA